MEDKFLLSLGCQEIRAVIYLKAMEATIFNSCVRAMAWQVELGEERPRLCCEFQLWDRSQNPITTKTVQNSVSIPVFVLVLLFNQMMVVGMAIVITASFLL